MNPMNTDFDDKEFRNAFVEEFVRTGIAFQIRALRQRENWSQGDLGKKTGKPQNVISRLEDPDYGSFTVKSLLELAAAFDVALMVRFVSFSDLWKASQRLSPRDLAVARYSDEVRAESALTDSIRTHTEAGAIKTSQTGSIDDIVSGQTELPDHPIKASLPYFDSYAGRTC